MKKKRSKRKRMDNTSELYHCILCQQEVPFSHYEAHIDYDEVLVDLQETDKIWRCTSCKNTPVSKSRIRKHVIDNHFVKRDVATYICLHLYNSFFHSKQISRQVFPFIKDYEKRVGCDFSKCQHFPPQAYPLLFVTTKTKELSLDFDKDPSVDDIVDGIKKDIMRTVNRIKVPLSYTVHHSRVCCYFLLPMLEVLLRGLSLYVFPEEEVKLFPLSDRISETPLKDTKEKFAQEYLTTGKVDFLIMDFQTYHNQSNSLRKIGKVNQSMEEIRKEMLDDDITSSIGSIPAFLVKSRKELDKNFQKIEMEVKLLLHGLHKKFGKSFILFLTDGFRFWIFKLQKRENLEYIRFKNPNYHMQNQSNRTTKTDEYCFEMLDLNYYSYKNKVVTEIKDGCDFETIVSFCLEILRGFYSDVDDTVKEMDVFLSPTSKRKKKMKLSKSGNRSRLSNSRIRN